MKVTLILIATFALVGALVGACGGGGDDDGPSPIDGRAIDARIDAPIDAAPISVVAIEATRTVAEGNAGATAVTVRVTVTPPSAQEIVVDYASAGDTATAPADFVSVADTLTLPPATQFKTITVMVNGDTLDEVDERFTIGLASVQHGELGNATATITITDDDAAPKVSVASASAAENAPAGLVFPVTLAAVSGRTVTVGRGLRRAQRHARVRARRAHEARAGADPRRRARRAR